MTTRRIDPALYDADGRPTAEHLRLAQAAFDRLARLPRYRGVLKVPKPPAGEPKP